MFCTPEDAESIFYGVRGNQELDLDELTFKLIVRSRDKPDSGSPYTVTLMAPSPQEKAEWTSDISQVRKMATIVPCFKMLLERQKEMKSLEKLVFR